jgi:two-component system, OmpR family, sensor kinase
MSAIASTLRRHWIEFAWGWFALVNIAIVFEIGQWETIPFHFVWVSLTLIYGLRKWRLGTTVIVMVIVTLISGGGLLHAAIHAGGPGLDELAEVPLMAAMFVAMVFYTERTKAATAAQQRMLERERNFIRDASHEFRTPITIARSYAELLRASVEEKGAA